MPFIERSRDNEGRLFLKYFLADDTLNDRGWRLSPESLESFAKSFVGKPFTVMKDVKESLFGDYHPFALKESATVQEDIDFAEKYAIGHIIDVTPTPKERLGAGATKGFEAIIEIEDPFAREELAKPDTKLIPSEVSPGIVRLAGSKTNVEEFWGLHLAAVPQGAYGPRAREVARCAGEHRACVHTLMSASQIAGPYTVNGVTWTPSRATYRDMTGTCPIGSLETLAASSFSSLNSDSNNFNSSMSYNTATGSAINSNVSKAPGPSTYGTNTFSTPGGATIATQSYNKPQQQTTQAQQPQQKIKLKLKDPKRFLANITKASEEKEKTPEEIAREEEEKKKQEEQAKLQQPPINTNQEQPVNTDNKVLGDFENTKKELDILKRKWELGFVIPHEAFVDKNGNFLKKEYEKEIDKVAHNAMPIEMVEEYYRNKIIARKYTEAQEQLATVPQKKSQGKLSASSIAISSQDNEEQVNETVELLQLMRGSA